jgi:predicted alpha/beta hydrolase family esterase
MSKSFLILHGLENHRPPEHWQFWLAEQLRATGAPVIYPGLPDPDAPQYDAWESALTQHLAALDPATERVVLCHSLACLLWLRAAAKLAPELRPDRLLLVAPPASDVVPDTAATFRLSDGTGTADAPGPERFDAAAVHASALGSVRVVGSDADPYDPVGVQAQFGNPLGVVADVLVAGGHINPDSGYGPWPSVLAWCLGGDGPVRGNVAG